MSEELKQELLRRQLKARQAASRDKPKEDVVMTTPDGGRVIRQQSGQLAFTSPGYSTTDQDAIARIMEGATGKQEAQRTTDELTISQNPVAARVQEFNQGAPIVGEWLDEGVGMVSPKAAEAMRQTSDAMERRYPGQSAGLNVAGGVAYTAPLFVAGSGTRTGNWISGAPSRLQQGLRASAVAAPAGVVEGAASFAGRAEPGERGQKATEGAAIGGGLAAVLGPLAPLLGDGVAALTRRVRGLDVRTIAEEFGLSRDAARVVQGYIKNDDMQAATNLLRRGGDDAMLAEAGPASRQLLDDAMSAGGAGLATGRARVVARTQGQAGRFQKTLNDVLGDARGGIKGRAKEIAQRTAKARQAAYDAAYAQPTPTTGPAGEALEAALERVSPNVMRQAVDEANEMMRDVGMRNMNIMASIDDTTGEVVFSQPLSVAQLDYIARGLGRVVDAGTDKLTGQVNDQARRATNQARAIRDALKEGVPGYDRALKLGGDKIRETQALVTGRKLLNSNTTVEDVRNAMSGASDAVKAEARKGLRENIEAVMGRTRATIADLEAGNVDFETGMNAVGESVTALRNMVTPDNLKKMRAVLGSDAKPLFDELRRMADVMVLRSAVARNSATAIRTAGREAMEATTAPGMLRRTAGEVGSPLEAGREITRTLAGTDRGSLNEAQQELYSEVADALTRIKGQEARQALDAVRRAMAGQTIRDEEAALIGRLVGPNVASLGYQAGTQALTPR